jgi:hypothetical protein
VRIPMTPFFLMILAIPFPPLRSKNPYSIWDFVCVLLAL